MQLGKVPHQLLGEFLRAIVSPDPSVLVGPQVGVDAAVLDLEGQLLVASSDPITFPTDLPGWYAVQVNANDVAVMGATPRWFLSTILLPAGTLPETATEVFNQVLHACQELNVALVGGHTEVTQGIEHIFVAGCMLGTVDRDSLVTTSGAQAGDSVLATKGIAIEGTALLGRDFSPQLITAGVDAITLQYARGLLDTLGISVVHDCSVLRHAARVHCMHDVTEGGLATALYEVAQAAGVGVVIEEGICTRITSVRRHLPSHRPRPLRSVVLRLSARYPSARRRARRVIRLGGGGNRRLRDRPRNRAGGGRQNDRR